MSVRVDPNSFMGRYLDAEGLELHRRGETEPPAASAGQSAGLAPESVLAEVNRRVTLGAVHAEATRAGLDAASLLDSKRVHEQAAALDPADPEFTRKVQDLVAQYSGARGVQGIPAAGTAPADPARARQWTIDDVNRSSPAECAAAMKGGLLADLGYPAPKRGRQR